jgi:plasmid stability protein
LEALVAQLVVRNLDNDVKRRLQERAARDGRSMEEAVREILRAAALQDDVPAPEPLGQRIARRFAGLGLSDDILEVRGQAARAADLDH